jgi:hypothetical protein
MSRLLTRAVLLVFLTFILFGCSSGPAFRVLFIGNSYTAANDLPGMVRDLADSVGRDVEIEAVVPGGWWLRDHASSPDTLSRIAEGGFDYVVLQEQSMVPADRVLADRESRPAAVSLGLAAIQGGARVVFFMTWGHRNGSAEVGQSSYASMQRAISGTYERLAAAVAGRVAPVGAAWWMSLVERPDIGLYQPDGSHPSVQGTYLAASVMTATLLDVDPTDFSDDFGLDADTASALRGFASRAINGERPWG